MSEENKETVVSELSLAINDTMKAWAKIAVFELKKSIALNKVGSSPNSTKELFRSFTHNVTTDGNGAPKKVTIGFLYHGKFVDMGVGKGQKVEDIKSNRETWAALSRREKSGKKRRKPVKWYSPIMYHEYQRAAEILAEKYGLKVPAEFEKILEQTVSGDIIL
jgi:hypothetical protein